MGNPKLDLDSLATHLRNEMHGKKLSIRGAAKEIGCSAATLARLLQGSDAPNSPEWVNLAKSVSWLGKSIADFEAGTPRRSSSLADVEVHLRALPNISEPDAEGLVAMVKAAYEAAAKERSKKGKAR